MSIALCTIEIGTEELKVRSHDGSSLTIPQPLPELGRALGIKKPHIAEDAKISITILSPGEPVWISFSDGQINATPREGSIMGTPTGLNVSFRIENGKLEIQCDGIKKPFKKVVDLSAPKTGKK